MTFTIVDVILIIIVLIFAISGFVLGLIQGVGAIIGLIAGVWVAGRYFMPLADWLTPILMGNAILSKILAFLIIFGLINRLVALLFYVLDKAFRIIAIIPFLKSINRLAGLILGLIEGVLFVGVTLYVIAKFGSSITWLIDDLNNSQIAHWLVLASKIIIALLPQAFDNIKSIF